MENLTNEQIVDIINFYKSCGISEDMYLSRNGVLDLFTLLGISPEFDDDGNRLPTVYEQLEIPPVFSCGEEVPIVFAIKHKVEKINKSPNIDNLTFTYVSAKEPEEDKDVLNKFKADYLSAISNGDLVEATRLYDMIDMMTGGKADEFIGVQFNAVKFYKKMQKQLLIDMFANFVILMILSQKGNLKDGLVKFDKLYKSFIENELKNSGIAVSKNESVPILSGITINVEDGEGSRKVNVKSQSKQNGRTIRTELSETLGGESEKPQNIVSFIKSKITMKVNKIKEKLEQTFSVSKPEQKDTGKKKIEETQADKNPKVLEND